MEPSPCLLPPRYAQAEQPDVSLFGMRYSGQSWHDSRYICVLMTTRDITLRLFWTQDFLKEPGWKMLEVHAAWEGITNHYAAAGHLKAWCLDPFYNLCHGLSRLLLRDRTAQSFLKLLKVYCPVGMTHIHTCTIIVTAYNAYNVYIYI